AAPIARHQRSSTQLTSLLINNAGALGGTPSELLHNAELMDLMLPIARADLTACEEYLYRPAPPLSCPITALGGVGDVTFDQSELTRWGEMTSATFEVVAMPGGHFFARTAAALLSWLAEDFRRVLGFSR
ncbi:thioesterase domain-containing protein, partial [Mycobacterium ulcerans]|nr:thioesterase domain-containing protein [Mycobacterium ulcerans]MEB3976412.1 thioesterase domain-containing protein [Mycobacterium ulcerans]MEB4005757.1 thioesterase domain-containing protein [Mycobacterium ulcerans]MEB4415266.1 thioesterase domain-containing protein [Mycobacterium ulcerans]MEB4433489.1 thioesterase domain-containing protein [Mycobacterium ulcerans]